MRDLTKEYSDIYKQFYINYSKPNTFFRKLALLFERWYRLKAFSSKPEANSILELGAGNLNHLKFEKYFSNYDFFESKDYLINP